MEIFHFGQLEAEKKKFKFFLKNILLKKGMQSYKTDARGSCRFKPNDFNTVEEKELSSHHSW